MSNLKLSELNSNYIYSELKKFQKNESLKICINICNSLNINSYNFVKSIIELTNEPYLLLDEYDLFNIIKGIVLNEKVFFEFLNLLSDDEYKNLYFIKNYFDSIYLCILKNKNLTKNEKINYFFKFLAYHLRVSNQINFSIEVLICLTGDKFYSIIEYLFKRNKDFLFINEKNTETILYLLIQDETITYNEAFNIIRSFNDLSSIPNMIKKYIYVLNSKNIFYDLLYNYITIHQKNDFISIFTNYINSYIVYYVLHYFYKIKYFFIN